MSEPIYDPRLSGDSHLVRLGLGVTAVAHGLFEGQPSLFFGQAKTPDTVGTPATDELNELGGMDDCVVLQFHTKEAILQHLERLYRMVKDLEAAHLRGEIQS